MGASIKSSQTCVWMVLVNGRSRIAPRDPTDRQPAAGAARPETKPRVPGVGRVSGRHNMTSGKERKITQLSVEKIECRED